MKKYILLLILFMPLFLFAQVEIVTSGTGSAYTLNVPGSFSLRNGIKVTFKAHTNNIASATLNVNGTGALPIIKEGGSSPLVASDIKNGQVVEVVYDGTSWQMLSPVANAPGTGNIIGMGNSNKVAFFTGVSNIGFNNNFHWDDANNRLGIGTSSPLRRLHIENIGSTLDSLGNILVYHNSSNNGIALSAISNNTGTIAGTTTYAQARLAGYFTTPVGTTDFGIWSRSSGWAGLFDNITRTGSYVGIAGLAANNNLRVVHSTNTTSDAAQYNTYTYNGSSSGINTALRIEATNNSTGINVATHGIYINATNNSTGSGATALGIGAYVSGSNSNGEKKGIEGSATGVGTTNYGIVGNASGASTNWAGFL